MLLYIEQNWAVREVTMAWVLGENKIYRTWHSFSQESASKRKFLPKLFSTPLKSRNNLFDNICCNRSHEEQTHVCFMWVAKRQTLSNIRCLPAVDCCQQDWLWYYRPQGVLLKIISLEPVLIPVLNSLLSESNSSIPRWQEWFAIGVKRIWILLLRKACKCFLFLKVKFAWYFCD